MVGSVVEMDVVFKTAMWRASQVSSISLCQWGHAVYLFSLYIGIQSICKIECFHVIGGINREAPSCVFLTMYAITKIHTDR